MNTNVEFFLEDAFSAIQPTSPAIARVVVEPDYESAPEAADLQQVRSELTELLSAQTPQESEMQSHDGFEVKIPSHYQLLSKYVRRITLHADRLEGDWIEVAPPGYWI